MLPGSNRAVLLACLSALACGQPPVKELDAAGAALELARSEGADVYAAERFGEAQAALEEARRRAEAKDYRGALSWATDAAERSRSAAQEAASARALARNAARVAEAEVLAALDEVAEIRAEAAKARIPERAFAELLPQLAEAASALESLAKIQAEGKFLEAKQLAAELKARVTPLPGVFREAQVSWETQHRKGRRSRR